LPSRRLSEYPRASLSVRGRGPGGRDTLWRLEEGPNRGSGADYSKDGVGEPVEGALSAVAGGALRDVTVVRRSSVAPAIRAEFGLSDSSASWLTLAVQGGFVMGTLLAAILNLPDVFKAPRFVALAALSGPRRTPYSPFMPKAPPSGPSFASRPGFSSPASIRLR